MVESSSRDGYVLVVNKTSLHLEIEKEDSIKGWAVALDYNRRLVCKETNLAASVLDGTDEVTMQVTDSYLDADEWEIGEHIEMK